MAGLFSALLALALPAPCPGCGDPMERAGPVCAGCATALAAARPMTARPDPAPPGLPPCMALGPYRGLLRDLVSAYKERGRHGLAVPLGDCLAAVAERSGSATTISPGPLLLVPVPATARAARLRRGDHMLRLARRAAARTRRHGGQAAVLCALRARPRPDSVGLSALERARAAQAALVPRPGLIAAVARVEHAWAQARRGVRRPEPAARSLNHGTSRVVVMDDVVTTGSTIAAACRALGSVGVRVDAAAVLAATERRRDRPG